VHIVLITPEIPGNTGAIARTCAGTNTPLHLVGKLGFSLEDKYVRRAGLDYWPRVPLFQHATLEDLSKAYPESRLWFFTKRAGKTLWDVEYKSTDMLVFGCETKGLPAELLNLDPDAHLRIPITDGVRSLNLANAANIALYEGLRQTQWTAPAHNL
jgi:tRNA (cytidine/uridine-2'-O-)-methyltransferase